MSKLSSLHLVLCFALALGACAADPADDSVLDPDGDGTPDVPATDPSLADEVAPRLVGHYVVKSAVTTVQDLPFFGETESVSEGYSVAEIRRDGDYFVLTEQACHVEISSSGDVETVIDDAVPQSTPALNTAIAISETGSDIAWTRPETATAVGAMLDDPMRDALPSDAADERVWDQDGDGNPGITVQLAGFASGDIYVVQRQRASYAGTLVGDGQLVGLVTDTSEQSVVGASNPLLNQNVPAVPHEDPNRSTITLNRVDAAYDCSRLIAELGALFP